VAPRPARMLTARRASTWPASCLPGRSPASRASTWRGSGLSADLAGCPPRTLGSANSRTRPPTPRRDTRRIPGVAPSAFSALLRATGPSWSYPLGELSATRSAPGASRRHQLRAPPDSSWSCPRRAARIYSQCPVWAEETATPAGPVEHARRTLRQRSPRPSPTTSGTGLPHVGSKQVGTQSRRGTASCDTSSILSLQ